MQVLQSATKFHFRELLDALTKYPFFSDVETEEPIKDLETKIEDVLVPYIFRGQRGFFSNERFSDSSRRC